MSIQYKRTIKLYEGISDGIAIAHTFENATLLANSFSKGKTLASEEAYFTKSYHTAIKITPPVPALPEYCWMVTNKFDPRVILED